MHPSSSGDTCQPTLCLSNEASSESLTFDLGDTHTNWIMDALTPWVHRHRHTRRRTYVSLVRPRSDSHYMYVNNSRDARSSSQLAIVPLLYVFWSRLLFPDWLTKACDSNLIRWSSSSAEIPLQTMGMNLPFPLPEMHFQSVGVAYPRDGTFAEDVLVGNFDPKFLSNGNS